jgi:hypothetical protein
MSTQIPSKQPAFARPARRPVFPPHIVAIAWFLADSNDVPAEDVTRFFDEVDRRWPGLPFRDFARAPRLAEALLLKTEGNA